MGGVTNFLSIVEARSLGTADIDKMVGAIDKQTASLDKLGESAHKVNDHPGFGAFAEKVKAGIEDPLHGIAGLAESALQSLGPLGTGVAAAAGVFTALAFGTFEAAKGLGEFGVRMRDTELRTGLAGKELSGYTFAAKAVGQEVGVVDRLMRGLTMAVEDNSAAGEKAQGWLKRFGVDIGDVRNGTASTSQVLMQISAGLNELPTQWERNKAGLDLFKRAGIELLPFLLELKENLHLADERGLGGLLSEGDIARFTALNKEVSAIEMKWDSFVRQAKEGLVVSVTWVGGLFGGGMQTDQSWLDKGAAAKELAADIENANRMKGRWGNYPQTGIPDLERRRLQSLENLTPQDAFTARLGAGGLSETARASIAQADEYQRQIKAAQAGIAQSAQDEKNKQVEAAGQEADRLRARYFGGKNALEKAYTDAKHDVEKYLQELETARQDKRPIEDVQAIGGKLADASKREASAKARLDALKETVEWEKQAAAFRTQADEREMTGIEKLLAKRDELLAQGKKLKAGAAELAEVSAAADRAVTAALAKSLDAFEGWDAGGAQKGIASSERWKNMTGPKGILNPFFGWEPIVEEAKKQAGANREIDDITLRSSRADIVRRSNRADRLQQLSFGPGHEAEAIDAGYQQRIGLAGQLAELENARIAKEYDADQARIESTKMLFDLQKEMGDAEAEREIKLAELQRQRLDGFRNTVVEGFNSLLSGPKGIEQFLKGQATKLADIVVGNAAEMLAPAAEKMTPHAGSGSMFGKLLAGSAFGANPKLDSAGTHLSMAAADLMAAARALAMSRTGGGGGAGPAGLFSRAPWAAGGGAGPSADYTPAGGDDLSAALGDFDSLHPGGDYGGAPTGGVGYAPLTSPGTNWGHVAGTAAALGGEAMGIYSGARSGGTRGDLTVAGSTLAMVGTILPLISKSLSVAGPIGMVAGLGLGLLSMALGDPKQQRSQAETDTMTAARYTPPTSSTYSVDRYGRSYDTDLAGNARAVTVHLTIPVQAFDAQSFIDHGEKVADAVSTVLEGALSTRLASNIRAAATVPK